MADERTAEQRAAEDALDDAITRVYRSYGGDMLPTQWVVCLAVHGVEDESDTDVSEVIPLPQTGMARYAIVGVLREATLRVENDPADA